MKMRFESKRVVQALVAIAAAAAVSGCSLSDNSSEEFASEITGGSTNVGADSLSVAKLVSPKGFLVLWSKRAGSYGEVIYTDDLSKPRGDGYPLTSNTTGIHRMVCKEVAADSRGAKYSCKPDNVTFSKSVYLKNGVRYFWLVNYGLDHTKGEVEATTTYRDGTLYVE